MMQVFPNRVYADSTGALVVLFGTPSRAVNWSLTGSGTLTALDTHTDAQGRAAARYVPGTAGDTVTIEATYGA